MHNTPVKFTLLDADMHTPSLTQADPAILDFSDPGAAAAYTAGCTHISGVADGTYTLKIFYERIDNRTNGAGEEMYSDFAGQPAALTLTVAGGAGTAMPLAVATT